MNVSSSSLPTILDKLQHYAEKTPDKKVFSFLGSGNGDISKSFGGTVERELTYSQLNEETDELAKFLSRSTQLQPGDRAVLVYPPSLDFTVAFLACLKAGVVAVPVFPPNPGRKDTLLMFSRIVESSGAKYALTSASYNHLKKLSSIKDSFTRLTMRATPSQWPDALTWVVTNNMSKSTTNAARQKMVSNEHLCFLQYTSGSTSEPKGVMITNENLSHNLTIITQELQAKEDTIVVSWLPQYHDMGLIGSYLGVIYCGGSGFYMSPLTFLQRPMIWIEAISKYHGTHIQAPNFAYKLTARKFVPNNYHDRNSNSNNSSIPLDLSSIRHMINAAEPVDETSINAFVDTFSPFGLDRSTMFPTYGLAEHTVFVCSGGKQIITVLKKDLEMKGKVTEVGNKDDFGPTGAETSTIVGCGYPSKQNIDVRIVDEASMVEVGNDFVGEIWINSPSKAAGYFNKSNESETLFMAKLRGNGADGYLRTGDLGFLHKNELFICGRLKDLIIVGGRNHYPQDIESTAEEVSPNLRPGCSAAFSVNPLAKGEEKVALILELREVPKVKDINQEYESLIAQIQGKIKQEHSISISHIMLLRPRTIPKTTSGKIARAWCRKAFVANTLDFVYKKTYKEIMEGTGGTSSNIESMEIENSPGAPQPPTSSNMSKYTASEIRAMDSATIRQNILVDIGNLASMPPESIDKNAPLVTMIDSMNISQFKGILEYQYATKLSDDYLFRESTCVSKLEEVVKLGYAPDDSDEVGGGNANGGENFQPTGKASGLAGSLGCPPGVFCTIS